MAQCGRTMTDETITYLVWCDDTEAGIGPSRIDAIGAESASRIYASENMKRPSSRLGAPSSEVFVVVARYDGEGELRRYAVRMTLDSELVAR